MDRAHSPAQEIFQRSHHPSRDHISEGDGLAVIREEQASPLPSRAEISRNVSESKPEKTEPPCVSCEECTDTHNNVKYGPEEVEDMLAKKEVQLRAQFDEELKAQLNAMTERFDRILENEQVRTCLMLREVHRDRKEKVQALQAQLECKNLAGLMYVLCSERRKSKLEKMRIIEQYTKYIHTLQDILTEGQKLILHLSRGHKTAARVDHEWRQKMRSIVKEFQEYVYHFAGGTPESNQYIFDVPALLKIEASVVDDPEEDPCTYEEETVEDEEVVSIPREKTWWEQLDSAHRPFVMFGDMEGFKPPQKRQITASLKAAVKTAPKKWKEYVFNEMTLKSECCNAVTIKDEYPTRLPVDKWECQGYHQDSIESALQSNGRPCSRRATSNSTEMRPMGSILKLVSTSSNIHAQPPVKTNLLAARDSMEIASTTKLREKRQGGCNGSKNVSICIARSRSSSRYFSEELEFTLKKDSEVVKPLHKDGKSKSVENEDVPIDGLGSNHRDSLQVISTHKPDPDHKINYEKICPMDQCQRMQVDSFMRGLPSYMTTNPYTLFEQSFTNYETCSPEQLEILKQRIENKKKVQVMEEESISLEFEPQVEGVAVQTSEIYSDLPPCTCRDPYPSTASSTNMVFNVQDLLPIKEALDEITKECFYNDRILFNRFQVVGQQESQHESTAKNNEEFKKQRIEEIKKILRQHPSMLDLFQPNARC